MRPNTSKNNLDLGNYLFCRSRDLNGAPAVSIHDGKPNDLRPLLLEDLRNALRCPVDLEPVQDFYIILALS